MIDNVIVREIGDQKYIISQEDMFSFRVAVQGAKTLLCVTDLARCCGFKAPEKVATRLDCYKVKLDTKIQNGARSLNVAMWYIGVDDAVAFVKERSVRESFTKWFLKDAVTELEDLAPSIERVPATPQPKARDNVTLSARIDRMIVELLTMKQEIS